MTRERPRSRFPQLRPTRGQLVLAAILTLLLGALVTTNYLEEHALRRYTETYARTETSSNNMLYTMRETLAYTDAADRYVSGAVPRRTVQVARALLAQRLSVMGENGLTAGQTAPPSYRDALQAMDDAVTNIPPGTLPPDRRESVATVILPTSSALSDEARRLLDTTASRIHSEARDSNAALLRGRLTQLILLVTTLLVAAILIVWVAVNVRRQYLKARIALDDDERALRATQSQLDRVSTLDRGQARVLERIATGAPAAAVMREIAQCASEVSGGSPVRITTGARSIVDPIGAAISGPPRWSAGFEASAASISGLIEVFESGEELDDLSRNAFQRCADLVILALDRDATSQQLSHQASHDTLTGLVNRSLLMTRLSDRLTAARRGGSGLALLFCDLDRFKMVNDSIGHAAGDQLLIEAANRLSAAVRETDTVARLGGDEFVVLCPEMAERRQAIALAERIRTSLSAPYSIEGKEAFVGASIGIAFADELTVSGAELMREADVAMYRAKLAEGSHINVFDSALEAEVAERLDLDAALRRALERDQLRLAAQPIVTLDTGRVTGFELLLQWRRPGLPDLSPVAFIPLAEDNGMIVDIGRWVLQEGIATLAQWRRRGLADGITVSVNVSARQVREPGFANEVLAMLCADGVPAEALVIELTEHALVDLRVAQAALDELRNAGVQVSLDDFGTGYSSLTQLRTLPVDQIKLDRSFATALDDGNDKQRAVVQSMVSLANALALDLVVEGIETLAERDALRAMGVRKGQGFLYRRPMEFADALLLLESGGVCTVAAAEGAPASP